MDDLLKSKMEKYQQASESEFFESKSCCSCSKTVKEGFVMEQNFAFNLQSIVESDMACVDGVCYVPTDQLEAVQEDNREESPRD